MHRLLLIDVFFWVPCIPPFFWGQMCVEVKVKAWSYSFLHLRLSGGVGGVLCRLMGNPCKNCYVVAVNYAKMTMGEERREKEKRAERSVCASCYNTFHLADRGSARNGNVPVISINEALSFLQRTQLHEQEGTLCPGSWGEAWGGALRSKWYPHATYPRGHKHFLLSLVSSSPPPLLSLLSSSSPKAKHNII